MLISPCYTISRMAEYCVIEKNHTVLYMHIKWFSVARCGD